VATPTPTYSEEAALSLTMDVVVSSPGPLMLPDGDFKIVVASATTSDFGGDNRLVTFRVRTDSQGRLAGDALWGRQAGMC
jgi:hypothetical protein